MAVLGLRRAYLRASTQQCRYTSSKAGSSFPDPFPLPLSSDVSHESSQDGLDESLLPPPIHRPNETITSLRARLVYQTRKRGTLESDLLLSTFAKENLPKMSEKELREFDKVIFLVYFINKSNFSPFSCSTSPIGTFITGQSIKGSHRRDGKARNYSRNSDCMPKMRAKLSGVCLHWMVGLHHYRLLEDLAGTRGLKMLQSIVQVD